MTNELLSVIIPTYNRVRYLERAIRSVVDQSLSCDELIVVDDGSTDGTSELLHRLAADGLRFRVLYQENRGAAAARNRGIMAAQGAFLAFLDSDDWWLTGKLARQTALMQDNPDFLISHTREIWFRKGQRVNQKKKHDPPHGNIFAASVRMCVVGMSTVMARRELFHSYGLFNESLPCCEDYELWLRVACREPFLLVPEALTCKEGGRKDQLSVIHRMGMDVYRIRALHSLVESGRLSRQQQGEAINSLVEKCMIYGQGCHKHGRAEEGDLYLEMAVSYQSSW